MRRLLLATSLLLGMATPMILGVSCSAEMPGPQVCDTRSRCKRGYACVLGRCRKEGTMPVSPDASRAVVQPDDVAWIGGGDARSLESLGSKIILGKSGDHEQLIMRFSLKLPDDKKLQKALLRLDPLPHCERTPGRIALEIADVLAPWSSARIARGRHPKLGVPMRIADASATPARPLLIDVTELVKRWREHQDRYYGIGVLATGNSPSGACFSSGLSGGVGPRLMLYFWPPATDAGSDAADAGDGDAGDAGNDGEAEQDESEEDDS